MSQDWASMRPGQAAPEFVTATAPHGATATRFNEAGAGCPGIQPPMVAIAAAM